MEFHHIGIACDDIEKVKELIKKTHTVVFDSGNVLDENQNASVCLLKTREGPDIELISGNIVKNMVRNGVTFYHLCYETKDIDETIKKLKIAGGLIVSLPKPAKLFNMKKVAFMNFSFG